MQVVGLDITLCRLKDALRLTKLLSLQNRVQFVLADAIRIPVADNCFDVVLGQSAWSHVGNKTSLFKECYRVLIPGGMIAFEDSLEGDQSCPEEYKRAAWRRNDGLQLVAVTADEYIGFLESAGIIDISFIELFNDWIRWLERVYESPMGQWPPEEKNAINELEMARSKATSYGRFIAMKP